MLIKIYFIYNFPHFLQEKRPQSSYFGLSISKNRSPKSTPNHDFGKVNANNVRIGAPGIGVQGCPDGFCQ